jgi:hypothetical protein
MPDLFDYIPHPRMHTRQVEGPPKVAAAAAQLHGQSAVAKLNAKVGLKITLIVGTMWCAYLFTLLALVSAPTAFKSGDKLVIIAWIAQTFLQLVLLPIIIVGQNVQAAAADKRAEQTYEDADAILHHALEIQKHLQAQDLALETLADKLGARLQLAEERE